MERDLLFVCYPRMYVQFLPLRTRTCVAFMLDVIRKVSCQSLIKIKLFR